MKNLFLVAFASVISIPAFACPNLTGTFVCPGDQHSPSTTMTATQSGTTVTTYNIHTVDSTGKATDDQFIADGQVRPIPTGEGVTVAASFTCEGDTAVRMDGSLDDAQVGHITIVSRFSLDAQGNLHNVADSVVGHYGPQHAEKTCLRQ